MLTYTKVAYNLISTYVNVLMSKELLDPSLFDTNETVLKIGLSKDTLRRYRKDRILKYGVDWQYGDAYGRSILYNLDNVQKALHQHATKRLEAV